MNSDTFVAPMLKLCQIRHWQNRVRRMLCINQVGPTLSRRRAFESIIVVNN